MRVPSSVDELTPAWLTQALGVEVTAVSSSPIGTGQTGSTYRLALSFAEPCDLPSTIVAKLGAEDPEVRRRVAQGYRAEVAFYREIAPTVSAPVPHCYAAALSEDATDVVLLLEDLAPAVQGDQLAGCPTEVVLAGARALAGLHGPRWCDPTWKQLEVLTIPVADESSAPGMGELVAMATGIFLDTLGPRMSADDRATLSEVAEAIPAFLLAAPERFALLHGDYRLDNLLLSPDGEVRVVDWQTLTVGLPARDLAYWVTTSVEPEVRRKVESEAVAAYHQALGRPEHGVAECEQDYVIGQLQVPLIATLGWAFTTQTPRGAAMMLAMVGRSCQALRDLFVLEAL